MTHTIVKISREGAIDGSEIRPHIAPADVVLDIGTGIRPQDYVVAGQVHICVDAFRPYLERLQKETAGDPRFVFLSSGWEDVVGMLPDRSVDSVFALDVLEHLEKAEGKRLIAEAERVTRGQIVIFTPFGFYPQSYEEGEADRWGMEGGYWQTHRSGWRPEEFDAEWRILVCPDMHDEDQHGDAIEEPFGAFWAILTQAPGSEAN